MRLRHVLLCGISICFTFLSSTATAEWTKQVISLRPGWNAVFLEVDPPDRSCDVVFEGLPVKSVWSWNRRIPVKQFDRDPSKLLPKAPDWLVYFPKNEARAFLSDLFAVRGGKAYLIEWGGEATEWTLEGRAGVVQQEWLPESFNLAGFYLDPQKQVKFQDFFKHDPALVNEPKFRMDSNGKWVPVQAGTDTLRAGEAYWIYAKESTRFNGPLAVNVDTVAGLDFGATGQEGYLYFENATDAPKTLSVRLLDSEAAPVTEATAKDDTGQPVEVIAGKPALSYKRLLAWDDVGEVVTVTVQPKSKERLPLAIRRAEMATSAKSTGSDSFAGVLQVTDGEGARYRVATKALANPTLAGLWVGNVRLDKVSETAIPGTPNPVDAASAFDFRLIFHIDEDENVNLLNKVYLMAKPDVGYVLLTKDELVPQYRGVATRDGEIVGRRISSPVFGFGRDGNGVVRDRIPLVGNAGAGAVLTGSYTLDYRDPVNPFLHAYHPDHNNLNEKYNEQQPLPEGFESYSFTRAIRMAFSNEDPEQLGDPAWGYTLLGGTYQEDISGVHKNTIRVTGTFRVSRVTSINELNDGN